MLLEMESRQCSERRERAMTEYKQRNVLIGRNCLAVVLHKSDAVQEGGHVIFSDFLQQNSMCFWNSCLSRSVSSLEFRGYLLPCTLLISGTDFSLEVVRSAWARRVLRPPKGYAIKKLGDVSGVVGMAPVPQTQFAPLSEALCKVVADLNSELSAATTATVKLKLEESFPEMQVPSEDILLRSFANLIKERKIVRSRNSYYVRGPESYQSTTERQMLMTNEEAILKLHGNAIQANEISQVPCEARSLSNQITKFNEASSTILSYRVNNGDTQYQKGEKKSLLGKILMRMQSLRERSGERVTFTAQFPPLEWTKRQFGHSVATQTQKIYSPSYKTAKHRMPWELRKKEFSHFFTSNGFPKPHSNDARKNVIMRYSPSQRHGNNFTKKRGRIRAEKNDVNIQATSPEDGAKLSSSSSPDAVTQFQPASGKRGSLYNTIPNRFIKHIRRLETKKENDIDALEGIERNSKEELSKKEHEVDPFSNTSEAKLAMSESSSELSMSFNGLESNKIDCVIQPPILKSSVQVPRPVLSEKENRPPIANEVTIDNTVNVEVTNSPPNYDKSNNNVSTVVTEETTVTKGNSKIVTVTSITTSLSHGKMRDTNKIENPNDSNLERTLDCNTSFNIEVE